MLPGKSGTEGLRLSACKMAFSSKLGGEGPRWAEARRGALSAGTARGVRCTSPEGRQARERELGRVTGLKARTRKGDSPEGRRSEKSEPESRAQAAALSCQARCEPRAGASRRASMRASCQPEVPGLFSWQRGCVIPGVRYDRRVLPKRRAVAMGVYLNPGAAMLRRARASRIYVRKNKVLRGSLRCSVLRYVGRNRSAIGVV